MRSLSFALLLMIVLGLGILAIVQQRRQVTSLRAAIQSPKEAREKPNGHPPSLPEFPRESERAHPPSNPELLRLRGEISVLRREVDATPQVKISPRDAEADWAFAHEGSKPSDQKDFVFFTNCVTAGSASPETALQTFYSSMRNQAKDPLTPTRMKQLWDVPDDFDEPGAGYSIDLGEGMGSEFGYRVLDQQALTTNTEQMTLEFERPDGNAFRRKVVLVNRNGAWRIQPVSVSKANAN